MALNVGVKALLGWVNSIKLQNEDANINDLQDGAVLLKLICLLKKEPSFCEVTEDRLKFIEDFVKRDCRFSADEGSSIGWDNIRDGINLSVEIAKVLLVLLYHDMMNDRCTVNALECCVQQELAHLTGSFVVESGGCIQLTEGIDLYLARKYIPLGRELFNKSETSSTGSTLSSSEDSPVFHRNHKVTFVDTEIVASSSLSKSPLEDIMNTPKFQLRKMKRQMALERDYRDGLERELANKHSTLAQRESHINQLQYRLDKLMEEQKDQEQVTRQQIDDLETKNDTLHQRLNEILKENKDLKTTSSLMEHKVDELSDENGALSAKVRRICSQLAIFEAEVKRLTATQAAAQVEWTSKTGLLESELIQAVDQKELLTEKIEILQGKIAHLEDEISKTTNKEVGENMGPVIEREMLEMEVRGLKSQLDHAYCSLKEAEADIKIKTQQLADYQQEIAHFKQLLNEQKSTAEEMIQLKDEALEKLHKEMSEQRKVLHQEIADLKSQLEQVEKQKAEQTSKLQQQISACKQETEKLKEMEHILHQTERKTKDLETKLSVATSLIEEKEEQINNLQLEVHMLTDETMKNREEIKAKEQEIAELSREKCNEQEDYSNKILTITAQVEDLTSSLKQAEQANQLAQSLLAESQQENIYQKEQLQQQIFTCEEEVQKLKVEMQDKNEQLIVLTSESSKKSELLENEINNLKDQLQSLDDSFKKANEQVLTQKNLLTRQQQDSAHQQEVLQQQLLGFEERVNSMKQEIQAKEEQMNVLKNQQSEEVKQLDDEIQRLKQHVEYLNSSLRTTELTLQSKENLLFEQKIQGSQQIEELQSQVVTSQDDVKRLNADIDAKEELLLQLKTEALKHSECLQQELNGLNDQIKSMNNSLEIAREQVKAKDVLMSKQEQESTMRIEELTKHRADLEKEVIQLREEIQSKETEIDNIRLESSKESGVLQKEILSLSDQVQQLNESLKTAREQVQAKDELLAEKEVVIQNMTTTSEEEIRSLKVQIHAKEEQLSELQKESTIQSDMLVDENNTLKNQIDHINNTLAKAEKKVQTQMETLDKQQQENTTQKELLQQQLSASENEVKNMKEEIQTKEEHMNLWKNQSSEQISKLHEEIDDLKKQVECLCSSLKTAGDNAQKNAHEKELLHQQLATSGDDLTKINAEIQAKEEQIALLKAETSKQLGSLNQEIQGLRKQIETLNASFRMAQEAMQTKEDLLFKKQQEFTQQGEELQCLQVKVQQVDILQEEINSRDQNLKILQEQVTSQGDLVQKTKGEVEAKEKLLAEMKTANLTEVSILQLEIQNLKGEVDAISQNLLATEKKSLATQQESAQEINVLQQKLVTVNAELNHHKETQAENLKLKEALQELNTNTLREREALVEDKEVLLSKILEKDNNSQDLERRIESIVCENERLTQANHVMERESQAYLKLESVLRQDLETLKLEKGKLLKEQQMTEDSHQTYMVQLQEQLSTKAKHAEHYKTQMETAQTHYNNKKELLLKSQGEVETLKHLLEVKEREIKAYVLEKQILNLDLEKAQTNEKNLFSKVASLEAQLAWADGTLRAQSKIHGGSLSGSCYEFPNTNSGICQRPQERKSRSCDSLDHSSLEDSLNSTRKLSAPGESSTPLVRSSERLAAKRRVQQAESLETLYFTPINTRQTNRMNAGKELDKNPTSSVKRRRTTQVINITMTKATPGGKEEETFYSLAPAHSQPNLFRDAPECPLKMAMLDTPAKKTSAASDQLVGLPGYRRSTIHSQSASTFCVGTENEPDVAPEDWLRIAEIQARNKACLPHLKSSYPVESETGCGNLFHYTDEELRMGDPTDTIRRASMMPGQLQDSLVSHRQSLMMGQAGASAGLHSNRLSLMPGQALSQMATSSQQKSGRDPKQSSLSLNKYSPEKKTKASCFPRPLTPKNKNVMSGSSNTHLHPALSPAERRQSMMFVVENTPNNKSYLKKGLSKLRSSTRKSPAQSSARKNQEENRSLGKLRGGVGQAGRLGNLKSPQTTARGLRKSPRTTSRPAKSPGLTASARKMMKRIKI